MTRWETNCLLAAVISTEKPQQATHTERRRPRSLERARNHFKQYGLEGRILTFPLSNATVELAAQTLHCEPGRITKTLAFMRADQVLLVVAAGDARIDNAKFKACFGAKARMVRPEETEARIGHAVGGICPFGVNEGIVVYLDESQGIPHRLPCLRQRQQRHWVDD